MVAVAHGHGREEEEETSHGGGGRRHLLPTGGWDLPPRRVLRNIFHGLRRRNPDFHGAKLVRTAAPAPAAGGGTGPAAVAEPQRVMPGLLLPEVRALDPAAAARCFLSLADGRLHDIAFPHAGAGARCVGSSRGWVVMLKHGPAGVAGAAGTATLRVAHPLLPAVEFPLPDEFSLFEAQVGAEEERFLVDDGPSHSHLPETSAEMLQRVCKPEEALMHNPYVAQVALSCSPAAAAGGGGCVALCVYRWRHCLAVARPGDASWTRVDVGWDWASVQPPPFRKVVSVAHHGGSFYAAC
ncbi:unnamed protein product [Urochloa humidicola]